MLHSGSDVGGLTYMIVVTKMSIQRSDVRVNVKHCIDKGTSCNPSHTLLFKYLSRNKFAKLLKSSHMSLKADVTLFEK